MREIVLDTETTGMSPNTGHRIVEIGALELVNQMPTGKSFHRKINPECDIDPEATKVHGLTREALEGEPVFADIVDEFMEFIADSRLVIHNAGFDMGFINAELGMLEREPIPMSRALDTLEMARKRFPGSPASLDALCRRFEIDNSHRELHGALIDADLLASVYIDLIGGRQRNLSLESGPVNRAADAGSGGIEGGIDSRRFDRPHDASEEEKAAHRKLLDRMERPLWDI